jgi:Leucine-rich repeat (LRR) protein
MDGSPTSAQDSRVTYLAKVCARRSQTKPRPNETDAAYLSRQTHLHLNNKSLTSSTVPEGACPSLKALYLFENEIQRVEGLGSLSQLTHLYLQNNQIEAFEPASLAGLRSLRKLYLNNNKLSSLAVLAPLVGLEELHASGQRLASGQTLDISPLVLSSMKRLRHLVLANNGLTSTAALASCRTLETVDLSKNKLGSLDALASLLESAPLREIDLRENGVSGSRQQLDAIIVACPSISKLNGRELIASERPYLQQLHRLGRRRIPASDSELRAPPPPGGVFN